MYINTTEMFCKAGYRERYAVEKFMDGEATIQIVGPADQRCVQFKFLTDKESASNGVTYSLMRKEWVN